MLVVTRAPAANAPSSANVAGGSFQLRTLVMYCQANDAGRSTSTDAWHVNAGSALIASLLKHPASSDRATKAPRVNLAPPHDEMIHLGREHRDVTMWLTLR